MFGRADGSTELFNGTATAGQTLIAAQTTLVAAATKLTGQVCPCIPVAGSTAVRLPQGASAPIVVINNAASAVTLLVFPPWNEATGAVAGGKINNGSANASLSVAQNAKAVFYPHANGVDFTAITSA
jgi:uncharacterized secreted protein with C-terminal beta-propeller domain